MLVSTVLGGGWFTLFGLGAALAAGFIVVGAASRRRVETALAGAVATMLLGLGAVVVIGQASQDDSLARRMERVALLPPEMSVAVDAAAAVAPDPWVVAFLAGRVTDFSPSEELGYLPTGLVGRPLRGIVVVDCAGSESLEIVAQDGDGLVVLGTVSCDREPQVVSIQVPEATVHTDPAASFVDGIEVSDVNQGPAGGMIRALLLVSLTDTSDPDRGALLATFVAAFGSDEPR